MQICVTPGWVCDWCRWKCSRSRTVQRWKESVMTVMEGASTLSQLRHGHSTKLAKRKRKTRQHSAFCERSQILRFISLSVYLPPSLCVLLLTTRLSWLDRFILLSYYILYSYYWQTFKISLRHGRVTTNYWLLHSMYPVSKYPITIIIPRNNTN